MQESMLINNTDKKTKNSPCSNITKTVLFSIGRIISTCGLVNQAVQQGFSMLGIPALVSKILSGIVAGSSASNTAITRTKAIYEDFSGQNQQATQNEQFSRGAKFFINTLKVISVTDALLYIANSISAVIQLECYYINDSACTDGFQWQNPYLLAFLPLGLLCGLSVGYCFWKFNYQRIVSKNVKNFIAYCGDFLGNLKKESIVIFSIFLLLTGLNFSSVAASNYFSTAKMLENFLGRASSHPLFQSLIWTNVGCGITIALFGSVAEAKNLLTQLSEKKLGYFKKWSCHNKAKPRIIALTLAVPLFVIDAIANGFAKYPGTILILNSLFENRMPLKKTLAVSNAVTGGFLYFSLNSRRSLDIVADVVPEHVVNEVAQKQISEITSLIEKPQKSRFSCVIL